MIGVRDLKGKKVRFKPKLLPIWGTDNFTIKSEFAFVLGGELCVWLEEKSWPILLASLEEVT